MPGIGGQWFKPFALTIACSVAVSLFVSFSLDPMLSAYWPDPHKPPNERGWLTRQLDKFNAWFNRQAQKYKTGHCLGARSPCGDDDNGGVDVLRVVLAPELWTDRTRAALIGIAIIVFGLTKGGLNIAARFVIAGGGLAAFVWVGAKAFGMTPMVLPAIRTVGTAFFPEDDRAEFIMALETPPGSNLEYTRLKAEEAARIARRIPR